MTTESTLRFGAQTDEGTSLLRIINLVRTGEAITRPELGKLTGLGRGVVSQRVDQAIKMGLLADGEFGASSGGRQPRKLRFCAEQGMIVVCALGALHVRVGIAGLDGDILEHMHRNWDISRGPGETIDMVFSMVDELLEKGNKQPVWSVVVGLPGPVDFLTGRPAAPAIMPGWNDFDVRTPFEERYDAPVWVDNDVNLLALGERAHRRDVPTDLIYCKIGLGMGAGLLSEGRIHRGANGAAGDIGHVRVAGSEAECRCGKIGCLEAVAGGWALVRDAELAIGQGAKGPLATRAGKAPLIPEDITLAAAEGDPLAISLIRKSAQVAGEAISALVNMFNPGVIVIGGVMASAGEVFLSEVRQRIYELSLPLATRDLIVLQSANDEREPLRGGVELARQQLFGVTFPRWFAHGRPSPEGVKATT
ncbi:ROK family protein [Arthrobacter sp. P2b]|uniref:ROK family protein n=1 Tax=Arthrobacter sp. P2b TaxID=1938741 RepID=UPI0009A647AC|nr:ROK family protein [Arthrobacter sp. P2b]SLJ91019.1 Sugar kinase of the NBD/HSP70 family, may contain an N-terminal HTH domain [Arthrobacter sp. P2b]